MDIVIGSNVDLAFVKGLTMDSVFCTNCGSAGGSMVLDDERIRNCIQQWISPRLAQPDDLICTICWTRAQEMIDASPTNSFRNCVLCSRTLQHRTRSHQLISLRTDTEHNVNIRNIILERLTPLQPRSSHYVCHPCWQQADRAANHYSIASSSRTINNPMRCANCSLRLLHERRHILDDDNILFLVQQQVAPRVVTANDYICGACYTLLYNRDTTLSSQGSQDELFMGHQHICLRCGCSVLRVRSHSILEERNRHIVEVVQNWIQPREIRTSDSLCHRCFQRAETASFSGVLPESTINPVPDNVETINIPDYSRASSTHNRCIYEHCRSTAQKQVPFVLRVRLIKDHKYYIPSGCRICEMHLTMQSWTELFNSDNVNRTFTAAHLVDIFELLKTENNIIDFENIGQMDENLIWYWLGRTKEQFWELEAELPPFTKRATALGAYLMKLRTGDSDDRISTLLKIGRSTLSKLISKARDIMLEHFVPVHLGLQHIRREQIVARNLYIPDSLFGNPGSELSQRKAIVIMDGTYIYVQKSTNYAYQKHTYSLHKYRNLVKPFMVVCCDGYIIDVLGPYPATKSDADIIKDEFEESKPMRDYFKSGDVMILDRGFRDCISLLESLGYCIYYPLSLEPGEHQLSTQSANNSRKVTLCRWVVEVVNGRFKRDFKLLRQEYFNKASKHLMGDFKVAAALINKFHPVLEDREDARIIISIIQEKMFTNNDLADFVEQNNLNRRRAQFESISVNNENVAFPQMNFDDLILIPLGIYQIKQARSYYGEHVRQDGSYIIEVCREIDQELISNLNLVNSENVSILRGKIQSRHISSKTYFVYILIDSSRIGREAILQYCCNCIVGRRTIGCCAHVMTIIWYLSYARHQDNINPPAQFLDNILITNTEHYN